MVLPLLLLRPPPSPLLIKGIVTYLKYCSFGLIPELSSSFAFPTPSLEANGTTRIHIERRFCQQRELRGWKASHSIIWASYWFFLASKCVCEEVLQRIPGFRGNDKELQTCHTHPTQQAVSIKLLHAFTLDFEPDSNLFHLRLVRSFLFAKPSIDKKEAVEVSIKMNGKTLIKASAFPLSLRRVLTV